MATALVAGAGIVGLTTALTLRADGFDVTVAERAPEIRALGTALGLWTNALSVFETVNLLKQVVSIGRANAMYFHDAAGQLMEPDESDAGEHTLLLVNRSEFTRMLADTVGAEHIQLNRAVRGYTQDRHAVTVEFADGTTGDYDLLVGADGINSVIREQVADGAKAAPYEGHYSWRAITANGGTVNEDVITIGRNRCRGGHLRTPDGRVYWLLNQLNSPDPTDSKRTDSLLRAAALNDTGWNDTLIDLITDTPEEEIIFSRIAVVPQLPRWVDGRVALVGDAAHAMSPHITAGATLGIEDAAVLARSLRTSPDIVNALLSYSENRIPRYRRVAELSAHVAAYETPLQYAERYGAFSQWMITTGEGAHNTAALSDLLKHHKSLNHHSSPASN